MGRVDGSLGFWVIAAVGELATREHSSKPTVTTQQTTRRPSLTDGGWVMSGAGLQNPTTPR